MFYFPGSDSDVEVLDAGPDMEAENLNLESGEEVERIEDILQERVAAFLLHIKDECNATQTIVNEIVKGMDDVQDLYLELVKVICNYIIRLCFVSFLQLD